MAPKRSGLILAPTMQGDMKVAVFGLGYVGTVTAACLAANGHDVWGVDPDELKVAAISDGTSPIVEPGLQALVAQAVVVGKAPRHRPARRCARRCRHLALVRWHSVCDERRNQPRLHLPRRGRSCGVAHGLGFFTTISYCRDPQHGPTRHGRGRQRRTACCLPGCRTRCRRCDVSGVSSGRLPG